jgi:hypothetical protein
MENISSVCRQTFCNDLVKLGKKRKRDRLAIIMVKAFYFDQAQATKS